MSTFSHRNKRKQRQERERERGEWQEQDRRLEIITCDESLVGPLCYQITVSFVDRVEPEGDSRFALHNVHSSKFQFPITYY
jgi:hypothetical protein